MLFNFFPTFLQVIDVKKCPKNPPYLVTLDQKWDARARANTLVNGAGFAWSQSDDVSERSLNLNSISSRPFWTYRWWPVADEDFGYSFGVLSKDSLSISCSTVKSPTNNRASRLLPLLNLILQSFFLILVDKNQWYNRIGFKMLELMNVLILTSNITV